jgi:hypothetical protein
MQISNKINSLYRRVLVYNLSGIIPYYLINEYPKSGGTWLGQMIGELISVPFPRNRFPILKPSIMHGHYLKKGKGLKNVIVLWRDGRDVMVSWYHHCFFENEIGNRSIVQIVRNDLKFNDVSAVKENLPSFIRYSFEKSKHPSFSWADFVRKWINQSGVVYVKYENLRQNPVDEVLRLIMELTGNLLERVKVKNAVVKYSFTSLSNRRPGQENKNSFIRKGIVGDWRNYFNKEAIDLFSKYAGDELIDLGYEKNYNWTDIY